MRFQIFFFILLFCVSNLLCVGQNMLEVNPNDVRIHYKGRWKNLDSNPQCTWQSSSITAKFMGTSISAKFMGGTESQDFRIIIDGDKENAKRVTISAKKGSYILAKNLSSVRKKTPCF